MSNVIAAQTVGSTRGGAAPIQPGALWRRWVGVTTAGEVAGFTAPALAGAVTTTAEVSGLAQAAVLVLAGAAEGGLLGWAQGLVLRRVLPGLDSRSWVRAT